MPEKLIDEIEDSIFIIYSNKSSSHVYLVKGSNKNILIDTGTKSNFSRIVEALSKISLKVTDIHLVVCTHEHYDHIGGISFFYNHSILAADRFAATKIELQDEYVIHSVYHGEEVEKTKINLWLENLVVFDIGNYKLKVIHTPGHTSGSICLYEMTKNFLFSGDTIFNGGVISKISDSGSYGDYINSLERLSCYKITKIFPGHGKICLDPENSIKESIEKAKKKLTEEVEKIKKEKQC
ncbi:MAG: MBL fold metallo-hydrolase [Brevinematia bacterium]